MDSDEDQEEEYDEDDEILDEEEDEDNLGRDDLDELNLYQLLGNQIFKFKKKMQGRSRVKKRKRMTKR